MNADIDHIYTLLNTVKIIFDAWRVCHAQLHVLECELGNLRQD